MWICPKVVCVFYPFLDKPALAIHDCLIDLDLNSVSAEDLNSCNSSFLHMISPQELIKSNVLALQKILMQKFLKKLFLRLSVLCKCVALMVCVCVCV